MEETLYRYNPWWENITDTKLVERPNELNRIIGTINNKQIVLLTGLRRIGKTSLFKLSIHHLITHLKVNPKRILYISLDDYNLARFSILEIVEEFRKIHNISFSEKLFLFLDEVVYKTDYEIQIKNLYDSQNVKVFASSSSSSLLKESKSLITGRNVVIEVLPLNFDEYLMFKNIVISKADLHLLDNHFENYLKTGGIPEYVITEDPAYIHELVDDIILKDIAALNNIRQPKVLQDFFMLLMERAGKQISLNKIASILGISVDTTSRYFEMFVKSYLIYPVSRYGKTNERLLAPKKVYAPDTGIRNYYTGFRDKGSIFENYVYLRLKKFKPEYIYKDQTEIDFRLKNGFVIEAKYHNEPLSKKQQKLLDDYKVSNQSVVRNFEDLKKLLEQLKKV
ncbi:MAG: ATP-binding protein [Bacteroidales bacterium]|nr:ATP-binding protein [Bacteroidales bacterium]